MARYIMFMFYYIRPMSCYLHVRFKFVSLKKRLFCHSCISAGFSLLFFATLDLFHAIYVLEQCFSLKNAIFKNNIFKKYVFSKRKMIIIVHHVVIIIFDILFHVITDQHN